jgi:hypothetical protein
MNRISTSIALLLTLGVTALGTACGEDDDQQNEPAAQSAELSDAEKRAAEAQQTPHPVDPTNVTEQTSLVKSCDTCGPLPDPWAKGPLPDPWAKTSSSSGTSSTSTSTDTSGHK